MPNDLIRQTEAAELFNVSKQYINKLIRTNKVKSYTVAKLVSKKEIEKFIKPSELVVDKVNQ